MVWWLDPLSLESVPFCLVVGSTVVGVGTLLFGNWIHCFWRGTLWFGGWIHCFWWLDPLFLDSVPFGLVVGSTVFGVATPFVVVL